MLIDTYQDYLYPQVSMEKFAGQKGPNTFRDHYLPNLAGDGQGSYFGTGTRSLVNDLFLSLTLPRNPKLAQQLPAEKQHEVENTQEYIDLDKQISDLVGKKDDRPMWLIPKKTTASFVFHLNFLLHSVNHSHFHFYYFYRRCRSFYCC